jgi:hypothetical protein
MSKKKIGRLAFRLEEDRWVAYWAHPTTMELAIFLGSIHIAAVQDERRRQAFMALMIEAATPIVEEAAGGKVEWRDPIPGPARDIGVRP